jgi:hypothetical protein
MIRKIGGIDQDVGISTTITVRNVSHGSATAETGMAERSAGFL